MEAAYVVIINASVGFQGLPQVPAAEVIVSHEYGTFNFSSWRGRDEVGEQRNEKWN